MAGELIPYKPGRWLQEIQRLRQSPASTEIIHAPKPLDRKQRKAMKVREELHRYDILGIPAIPEIYDLPRICVVRKLPYMSRYMLRGADYEYAQDIRHKEGMNAVEYDGRWTVTFPLAEEICAWCRAWGHGALFCCRCEAWCCYGQVVGSSGRCGMCGSDWRRIGLGDVKVIGFSLKR